MYLTIFKHRASTPLYPRGTHGRDSWLLTGLALAVVAIQGMSQRVENLSPLSRSLSLLLLFSLL